MRHGVLLDVAALKGLDMLPEAYEITAEDVQQALKKQSLTLRPGDAVLLHTGWGKLWEKDNPRDMKSWLGLGVAAAAWLVQQDLLLGGAGAPVAPMAIR